MNWKTQTMSTIGKTHLRSGRPCQDRTFALSESGVTAVSLSDGAGSAAHSEVGAAIAAETACRLLCSRFDQLYGAASPQFVRSTVLAAVREGIQQQAKQMNIPMRELACTLLAAAVKGDRFLLLHVGDGVIGYRKNGVLRPISKPCNGEFSNTTVFVTMNTALTEGRVLRGQDAAVEGFLLMSDGCEAALYDKRKGTLAPILHRLMKRCCLFDRDSADAALEPLLRLGIAARTGDDCSLAFLTRPCGSFGNWNRMQVREQADVLGIQTGNKARRRRAVRRESQRCGVVRKEVTAG